VYGKGQREKLERRVMGCSIRKRGKVKKVRIGIRE
jgi:hypothetical protein